MEDDQLKFRDLVSRDLIFEDLPARTREEALTTMAAYLVKLGYCKSSFVQAILDREASYPSGLPMQGINIAIPHTDAVHVKKSAMLFARLRAPVEFKSMGDPSETLQVSLISMFALKEKKRIGDLLEAFITVYQDPTFLKQLCESPSKDQLFLLLRTRVEDYENR